MQHRAALAECLVPPIGHYRSSRLAPRTRRLLGRSRGRQASEPGAPQSVLTPGPRGARKNRKWTAPLTRAILVSAPKITSSSRCAQRLEAYGEQVPPGGDVGTAITILEGAPPNILLFRRAAQILPPTDAPAGSPPNGKTGSGARLPALELGPGGRVSLAGVVPRGRSVRSSPGPKRRAIVRAPATAPSAALDQSTNICT